MRAITKALLAIGVALTVVAGLWALIAPSQLVKYPSDVDKTAVATGRFTLYVDPATGSVRAHPQVLPLTIHRRLYVVSSNGSQAIVREGDVEQVTGRALAKAGQGLAKLGVAPRARARGEA